MPAFANVRTLLTLVQRGTLFGLFLILGGTTTKEEGSQGTRSASRERVASQTPEQFPPLQSEAERLPRIVFVSRNPINNEDRGAIPGMGPRYRTAIVGGKLIVREPNGSLRTLVDSTRLIDMSDPCPSWDGKRVLFSGIVHPDSNWRIYQVSVDGSDFRQLTYTDRFLDLSQFGEAAVLFTRYDDFDPCLLPSGKIVFASTRYPSLATSGQVLTSNLFVMKADGSDIQRITTERNGAEEPAIDPVTGRIVFSRWWLNIDRPSNMTRNGLARSGETALTSDVGNVWQTVTVKPDGDELKLYAGFPRTRSGLQAYKPSLMRDGSLLSTFSPFTSLVEGIGGTGIRWFKAGVDFERHIIGVRSDVSPTHLTDVLPPYATDPIEISPGMILMSYSQDGIDYGLYTCKPDGSELRKLIDLPGTLELDAQILEARRVPPVISETFRRTSLELPPTEDPTTYHVNDVFRFDCKNVFTNGAVDEPMPDAPRIVKDAKIRFYMNVQRQNPRDPDPSILLKEAPVLANGSIHEHDVPAEVPLFEQLVDSEGKILETTDGKFAHATGFNYERQGGGTKCVGCHAGHSVLQVPLNSEEAEWFNVSPSATVTASSVFEDLPGTAYRPRRVVDRQARTGGDSVNWVANEGVGASVHLKWDLPVEAKQLVLYNIKPEKEAGTNTVVRDAEILLYHGAEEVGRIPSTGRLSGNGTIVNISHTTLDAIRISIKEFSGRFRRRAVTGLAEVEVIARIAPINYQFRAGD